MESKKVKNLDRQQLPPQKKRDGIEEPRDFRGPAGSSSHSLTTSRRSEETETATATESFPFVVSRGPDILPNLPNEDSISLSPPTSSIFSSSASASSKEETGRKSSESPEGKRPALVLNVGGTTSGDIHDGSTSTSLGSRRVSSVMKRRGHLTLPGSMIFSGGPPLGAQEAAGWTMPPPSATTATTTTTTTSSTAAAPVAHHGPLVHPFLLLRQAPQPIRNRDHASTRHLQGRHQSVEPSPSSLPLVGGPLLAGSNLLIDDRTQVVLEEIAAGAAGRRVPHLSPTDPSNTFLLGLHTDQLIAPETLGKDPGQHHYPEACRPRIQWYDDRQQRTLQAVARNPPFSPDIPFFEDALLPQKTRNKTGKRGNDGISAWQELANKDGDFDKVVLEYEDENAKDVLDVGRANLPFGRRRRRSDHEAECSRQGGHAKTENDHNTNCAGSLLGSFSVDEEADSLQPPSQPSKKSYGQALWDERYKELQHYQVEYGNCNVPFNFTENLLLASWVKRQRYQYKCKVKGEPSHLTDDRQDMLEKIGFVWDTHVAAWDEKFEEIKVFFRCNGHCRVTIRNKELKAWCKRQRRQYKQYLEAGGNHATMTTERVERLNTVNFQWQALRPAVSQTSMDATIRITPIPEAAGTLPSSTRMVSSRASEYLNSSSQSSSSVGGASTEPHEKKKWGERP